MKKPTLAAVALAAAACSGEPPPPCKDTFAPTSYMPDLDMQVGDTVTTDLANHFGPYYCTLGYADEFEAGSADPAVSVSAGGGVLTTIAVEEADSVRVTVGVTEYRRDPTAFHEFFVSVE